MSDARSPEARIARLEACFARLEERINALTDDLKQWKTEMLRRLAENNENAKKLMEERARDRAELVTMDLYNSRHQELKTISESAYREINQKIDAMSIRIDQKLSDHERDDNAAHKEQDAEIGDIREKDIKEINTWINNQKGRQVAVAGFLVLVSGLVGVAVQVIFHVFSGK